VAKQYIYLFNFTLKCFFLLIKRCFSSRIFLFLQGARKNRRRLVEAAEGRVGGRRGRRIRSSGREEEAAEAAQESRQEGETTSEALGSILWKNV
jgi:hypothetical protein